MCAYFFLKFLTPKTNTNVKMYILLLSGAQTLLLTLMNYYSDFEGIGSVLYWIGLFLFAVKMLNGNMVKNAFASMVPLLTAYIITTLDMNFIAAINNMSISELVHDRSIARITLLLSIQLVYDLFLKIILKATPHNGSDVIVTSCIFAPVTLTVCTKPLPLSTPMCALYPKNH